MHTIWTVKSVISHFCFSFFRLKKCYTVGMRADCVVPEDQCLKKRMAKNKSNGTYLFLSASKDKLLRLLELTLASGIDVGQGINVGPGKVGEKNKRRASNTHFLCSK